MSGKHHWVKYLPNFTGFNNGQNMQIVVQRTSGHFPLQAQCLIVAKNKVGAPKSCDISAIHMICNPTE